MPILNIAAPHENDADELLGFELGNRAFFESWINARPADYYSREGVARAIETAAQDAAQDLAYQFLVRENDILVGRLNLTQIKRPHFQSAALGYRIGSKYTGRGIAKEAVRLGLEIAFDELSLMRVEATVRPQNAGSIRVLE